MINGFTHPKSYVPPRRDFRVLHGAHFWPQKVQSFTSIYQFVLKSFTVCTGAYV